MRASRVVIIVILALGMVAASCSGTAGPSGDASSTSSTETTAPSTTATTSSTTTTTSFAALRDLDVTVEAPPFEEVSLTTEDGVTLGARLWRGSDTAVLVGHDFDNPNPGSRGQRPPQSGETVLWLSGVLAREGYTVFSPDYRGHGISGGELNKNTGSVDLRAAYDWLVAEGARQVVVVGWLGSGTVAVVLDEEQSDVEFAGIALLFSPPQEAGHDAQSVIGNLQAPTTFFGINPGTTPRFAKLLSDAAGNSLGHHSYDAVPTALTFVDVYGADLASRIIDFIEIVTS